MGEAYAIFGLFFSIIGIIHLTFFGLMFDHNAISFALVSSESGWDAFEKAKICYSGAIIYTFILILSLLALLYFKYTRPSDSIVREFELV
ncbi:unnamed protein product [Phytomonas sp. Hart1]|nr:unnamed protein product [Phytomonas sp. Hart1]|eukprot:CCW69606.1 unnamed protein product [Phytomonas sp. isolate Hart1]